MDCLLVPCIVQTTVSVQLFNVLWFQWIIHRNPAVWIPYNCLTYYPLDNNRAGLVWVGSAICKAYVCSLICHLQIVHDMPMDNLSGHQGFPNYGLLTSLTKYGLVQPLMLLLDSNVLGWFHHCAFHWVLRLPGLMIHVSGSKGDSLESRLASASTNFMAEGGLALDIKHALALLVLVKDHRQGRVDHT